ncbi:hypothetical protein GE09DRAFT_1056276 [Coniochaeta sp. 2T2.1]|nr:hypothetical protein GE09DRAFT_1056276 [Coniochaeta sp. 2T2.1]
MFVLKYLSQILSILAAGCALASAAAVVNRNATDATEVSHFINECQSWSVGINFNGVPDVPTWHWSLSADGWECQDRNKNLVCSYLFLSRCFNNDYAGRIVPSSFGDGTFADTCQKCRLDPAFPGMLFCICDKITDSGLVKVRVGVNLLTWTWVRRAEAENETRRPYRDVPIRQSEGIPRIGSDCNAKLHVSENAFPGKPCKRRIMYYIEVL